MGWKSRMDEEKGRKEERDGKAKGRGGRSGWSRSKWNEEGKRKREREKGNGIGRKTIAECGDPEL